MLSNTARPQNTPGSSNSPNSPDSPHAPASPDSPGTPAHPHEKPVAVLVDDDALVRLLWKNAAKASGKPFLAFASASELFQNLNLFDPTTPLYIDSDLGGSVRGEEVAYQLHQKGFKELYLATGYEMDQFPSMPWIKEIVGKEPPPDLFKK